LYFNDSARPREISSQSAKVNILRTMSILTHRTQDHMLRPPDIRAAAKGIRTNCDIDPIAL
jgi:hypothetical protein